MDRPVMKAVQARVVEQMAVRLPEFRMIEKPGSIHRQGGIFEFRLADEWCFYFRLWVSEYYNEFGFTAGWSEDGGFPYGRAGGIPLGCREKGVDPDGPIDGKMCFDVRQLIDPCADFSTRRRDYPLKHLPSSWYSDEVKTGKVPLPDDVVAVVHHAVDQSVQELIDFAIPYFQQVASDHGYEYKREHSQT